MAPIQHSSGLDSLVFGTMRLKPSCTNLLEYLLQSGVRRFHSSLEYDSFSHFTNALPVACAKAGVDISSLRHIVKLASPHFGESRFDAGDVSAKIDYYRHHLAVEKLDIVQWMARMDLADDAARVQCLESEDSLISAFAEEAKNSGVIERFGCFPYSHSFRHAVVRKPWCDALLDYLNIEETDALATIDELRENQSLIAIRPFYPTMVDPDSLKPEKTIPTVHACLAYVLENEKVEAVVASAGSKEHAKELVELVHAQRSSCMSAEAPP